VEDIVGLTMVVVVVVVVVVDNFDYQENWAVKLEVVVDCLESWVVK
jgi:hypothetical protein